MTITSDALLAFLLKDTFTRSDLLHRTGVIGDFLDFYLFKSPEAHSDNPVKDFFEANTVDAFSQTVVENFYTHFGPDFSVKTVRNLIQETSAKIEKMKRLTIYTSSVFDNANTMSLQMWVRENIGKDVLIEYKVDNSYTGGCGLSWNGMFNDYSFSFYFEKNKNEVRALMNMLPAQKEAVPTVKTV